MLFSEQNCRDITMGNSHHRNRDRNQDRDRDRNRSAMETHPNQDNEEEKIPLNLWHHCGTQCTFGHPSQH